jgi:hypothetical protein
MFTDNSCKLPLRPDVTLSNGRVIRHEYMPNGVQNAIMVDGELMSDDEWNEYCELLKRKK